MDDEYKNPEEQFESPEEVPQEEPQPERPPGGEPVPADYEDYDLYVKDLINYQVSKAGATSAERMIAERPITVLGEAVRQGLHQAFSEQQAARQPPPGTLTPFSDDPYRQQRQDLIKLSMEYSREAIMAREAGKNEEANRWRDRQRGIERDLSKLPPPPEVQHAQDVADHFDEQGMKFLMDPKQAENPCWQSERLKIDSPVVVQRANERAKSIIRLPMEDAPFGNPLACEPKNMVSIELPPDVMQSLKMQIKGIGDPDAAFRRAWSVLHTTGYAGGVKRVVQPKGEKAQSESEEDPNRMSWRRFCEWRQETEDRRRGRRRQSFVMPRKNRGENF